MVKDFEPVMLLPSAPMVLIAKKQRRQPICQSFIAWLKANPDKASMGTAGVGSPPHMLALMFRQRTETHFGIIPYRGAGPAMQDVMAGQIDATFITVAPALPQIASGNVKVFGLYGAKAHGGSAEYPDHGRSRSADLLLLLLVGVVRAARDAAGAIAPSALRPLRRCATHRFAKNSTPRLSSFQPPISNAGGAGGAGVRRDREMVAVHQACQHQGRLRLRSGGR